MWEIQAQLRQDFSKLSQTLFHTCRMSGLRGPPQSFSASSHSTQETYPEKSKELPLSHSHRKRAGLSCSPWGPPPCDPLQLCPQGWKVSGVWRPRWSSLGMEGRAGLWVHTGLRTRRPAWPGASCPATIIFCLYDLPSASQSLWEELSLLPTPWGCCGIK